MVKKSFYSFFFNRSMKYWIVVLFLLSLLLRLFILICDPILSRDSYLYIQLAEIQNEGEVFERPLVSWIPPFYLFAIRVLMSLGISAMTAGLTFSLFAGSFIPVITLGIAWEITQNKKIALCSALLIAVHPEMVKLSTQVLRDMVYLFFIGLAVYFFLTGLRQRRWWCWFGCGTGFAFSLLVRYESIEMSAIFFLSFIVMIISRRIIWQQAVRGISVICISAIISFWVITSIALRNNNTFQTYSNYYTKIIYKIRNHYFDVE